MKKEIKVRLTFGSLLMLFVLSFSGSQLQAQNELPDSIVELRLEYLKNSLKKDKLKTQYWWYGWLGAYSGATIGQGAVYFLSNDKSLKQDMALGAATTLIGAAGQFISPFYPDKKIDKLMLLPEDSLEERMQKLFFAEILLKEYATREKNALTWQNHILPTAVNLAGGIITWLGFKRSIWAGIGNFALNTAITEIQIWTQPKFAKKRYDKYYENHILSNNAHVYEPGINWTLGAYPGGVALRVVF